MKYETLCGMQECEMVWFHTHIFVCSECEIGVQDASE